VKKIFVDTLMGLAERDKRIFLLTGDLGFSVLEGFKKRFPNRFYNMGIAEQNMIGVAAGLAISGKIVFVYSIASFLTMRCLEQIRDDICYHNLAVCLVGVGGGLEYGAMGHTHHSIEDIALMRPLTNMTVIAPGDPGETAMAVRCIAQVKRPVYLRLSKDRGMAINPKIGFKIGKGVILEEGSDVTIMASGSMLATAKHAAEQLKVKRISVRLISMPTIKPIDRELILQSARKTKAIFTVEEHSVVGGLGSAVGEVLSESRYKVLFRRFALPETYNNFVGCREYLLRKFNLLPEAISKGIISLMKGRIV